MIPFSIHDVGAASLLPPREILVSQWADENRVLTGAASAERGQWRTRPYQREPMDVLSPSHACRQVVLLSAAQMMKTEVLLNFLGFIAEVDPGPVLVVEPRAEDAKALSKDRVAPMFRATPSLRGKIAAVKSRDSDNTTLHKAFVNGAGHITFTGAISPSGLAMRPIRYALLDEVDRYPASAGTEGDPVSLAIQRTAEFAHNKKIVMASTPTIKGLSRIELAWLESDQRDYFVPCPMCGHYQVLVLGDGTGPGLVWPEGKPEEAMYRCAGCRELIPHHEKARMVDCGEYRAQNPSSPIPGFRLSQLISPKRSWGSIATEFLAAKKSPETLKAFMNTVLAELWEETHEVPTDAHALWNRCEPFEAEVPEEVALITAGVDVQADRLEMEIVGWGRDEESWSIAYHVIPGDVTRNEVWDHLEGLLLSEYLHAAGLPMRIVAACVDCGFKDATVLRFTRDRYNRRVYATKGRAGASPIWPRKPSRKNQTPFFMIGVDAAKTAIYDRLKIREPGPGYCHFPMGRELEYFEQLTAEKKFTRYHNGFPKQEWRKPANARNEGLDARVLGYAALHALYASGLRLNVHCDRFAQMARSQRKDMTDAPPAQAAVTKAAQTEPPQPALSERAEEPWKPHPAAGPRYVGRFDVSNWLG
jgi:phage terminase large subunit GpA-like protein